jgi:hypothetical protein
MRCLFRLTPASAFLRIPILSRFAQKQVISSVSCSPQRFAACSVTPRARFTTVTTTPTSSTSPPVAASESTRPESKLELDAFGEPRVMAWLPKVKTSPRKLNLVAKLVRRMGLEQALMQLQFCSKKMADVVSKTIHDAKWNAVNNNVRILPMLYLSIATAAFVLKPVICRAGTPVACT